MSRSGKMRKKTKSRVKRQETRDVDDTANISDMVDRMVVATLPDATLFFGVLLDYEVEEGWVDLVDMVGGNLSSSRPKLYRSKEVVRIDTVYSVRIASVSDLHLRDMIMRIGSGQVLDREIVFFPASRR